jgi:hypothetical protein
MPTATDFLRPLIPVPARHWLRNRARDLLHWTTYGRISPQEIDRLNERGLFIVGCARSGTKIFCDCLNLSPDIMLLDEAHLFFNSDLGDFPKQFNAQHARWRQYRAKGTYLPPAIKTERGGLASLMRLGKYYRFVGEKIALVPHDIRVGKTIPELFFDFHARYFLGARYFLIARNPAETVLSMSRLFKDSSQVYLVRCWLDALRVQLDVLDLFPRAHFVFFENLRREAILRIGSILGVEIPIDSCTISDDRKESRLQACQLPDELAGVHPLLEPCLNLYRDLKSAFDPETFALSENVPRQRAAAGGFLSQMRKRIDAQLADVKEFSLERPKSDQVSRAEEPYKVFWFKYRPAKRRATTIESEEQLSESIR